MLEAMPVTFYCEKGNASAASRQANEGGEALGIGAASAYHERVPSKRNPSLLETRHLIPGRAANLSQLSGGVLKPAAMDPTFLRETS
jgi:hypothetical protein